VGEIPDVQVAEAALGYAEDGGVLVLASVPAAGPARAIEWFISRFGGNREGEIRNRVSDVLVSSVCLDTRGACAMELDRAILQSVRQGAPLPNLMAG
jgi:Tfp pilus assembly pilus retraction ATPase PilT